MREYKHDKTMKCIPIRERRNAIYTVRFFRKDEQPNEEYYYNSMQVALEHFMLFENDDSNLYEKICLTMEK